MTKNNICRIWVDRDFAKLFKMKAVSKGKNMIDYSKDFIELLDDYDRKDDKGRIKYDFRF